MERRTFSTNACMSFALTEPPNWAHRRKWLAYVLLVAGRQVDTRHADGHSVGSVSPRICHVSTTAGQSMMPWEATWVCANSEPLPAKRSSRCSISDVSNSRTARSRHSRHGQFHTQWRSMSPCPLQVLQGPTGAESDSTHSPLCTWKNSTPPTTLNRCRMTFLSRAPAGLRPTVKSGSADACLEELDSVSYLSF